MSETKTLQPETVLGPLLPKGAPRGRSGRKPKKPNKPLGAADEGKRDLVLELHGKGWSLEAIGNEVGMARTKVHQIINKAKKAREQEAALSNPAVLDKYVRPELWVDHGKEKLVILKSETPWALEKMFGIPRGLVRQSFLEKARQTIERHYPHLRKSAVHVAAEKKGEEFFVQIPDWQKQRFDQIIRLCDLLETMTFDGHTSD